MDNQLQKIQELETKNQELTKKLDELSNKFEELKGVVSTHTHGGLDGSKQFYNDPIVLKSGIGISSGKYQFIDVEDLVNNRTIGGLVVGDGAKGSGTVDTAQETSQFFIEHYYGTLNTFIESFRTPLYDGVDNGNITSGGTTMSQTKFSWATDELAGAYVIVYDSANTATVSPPAEFDVYEIASNTATTLTITGGTWTFTDASANFTVFMPVYLGSANFPFRRLYTMEGTGSGIRFGVGDTAGGQNGLLYMDATGDLYWRPKTGAAVKLN
jgi:hypothetical protein